MKHRTLAAGLLLTLLAAPATAMYSPRLGRFLQRDPIGYADGMSLYEYASSAALDTTDPEGLDAANESTRCIPRLMSSEEIVYRTQMVYGSSEQWRTWGAEGIYYRKMEGTWRKKLLAKADLVAVDEAFEIEVEGMAATFYGMWLSDAFRIVASGVVSCECMTASTEPNPCVITVAAIPGSTWQKSEGELGLAAQADVVYRTLCEADVAFSAAASNGGTNAVGAVLRVGKSFGASVTFPGGGVGATVSLGQLKWRCVYE